MTDDDQGDDDHDDRERDANRVERVVYILDAEVTDPDEIVDAINACCDDPGDDDERRGWTWWLGLPPAERQAVKAAGRALRGGELAVVELWELRKANAISGGTLPPLIARA